MKGPIRTDQPGVKFLTLLTDTDGKSTLGEDRLTGFVERSLGGKAAPLWMKVFQGDLDKVVFTILPAGWTGEWHESPGPQWVVALSGRWFIETQDGKRIEMNAGEIHWGADQGTATIGGNTGHRSGALGDDDCVLLMVRFKENELLDPAVRNL
jgi:hypothetical protein